MTNYSHSRLGTFTSCKRKYKFQYVDRVKVDIPTTVEAFMGNLVHKALDKLYRDLGHSKLNTCEEIVEYFRALWEKKWSDDILIVKDYSEKNYQDMGVKYITDYYEHYKPFNQNRIVGLETMSFLDLNDGNRYYIRIDRLSTDGDGTYFVCDYKTNKRLSAQEELDEDRQLAMYSIWVKNKYPDCKAVKLVWYFLAHDKEMVSERSDEQLEDLKSGTEELIRVIEQNDEYPVNVTRLCDWCVYKSMCPAWSHEEAISQKTLSEFKDDDGVKLVDAYAILLESKKKITEDISKLKEQLIEFSRSKGVDGIFGTEKKVNIKIVKELDLPSKQDRGELNEFVRNKGLWDDYSELDMHKVKAAIRDGELDWECEQKEAHKVTLSNRKKPIS